MVDDYEPPSEKEAKTRSIYDFIDRDYKAEFKQMNRRYKQLQEAQEKFEMFKEFRSDKGYSEQIYVIKSEIDEFIKLYPEHLI